MSDEAASVPTVHLTCLGLAAAPALFPGRQETSCPIGGYHYSPPISFAIG